MNSAKPTILLTGASSGIGAALLEHYLNIGHEVISLSRRESVKHPLHRHFLADITQEEAVLEVMAELKKSQTNVQVLINNAGIASMNYMISTPVSKVREIMETNFTGLFLVTREVSKMMMGLPYGRIINISSVSVPLHLEWQSVYASSKAAVEEFTRITAKELAPFQITINNLGVNPVQTALTASIPEPNLNAVIQQQAIKSHGQVSDIIHALNFFMSESGGAITGQTLYLNGIF